MNELISHNQLARLLLIILVIACTAGIARADEDWRDLHKEVKAGRLLPMATVMNKLEAEYTGLIVEVEFEQEDGLTVYEIEMLGKDGQMVEFELNAKTGEIISIEGSNVERMKRR